MIKSSSEENIQYKCSVIQGGYEKLRQMSSNLKGISRKIKKLTKTFNQITNYIDNTWMMNISTDFYLWQPKFLKILSHGIQVFVIESSLKFSSILSISWINLSSVVTSRYSQHAGWPVSEPLNCVASDWHDESCQVFITSTPRCTFLCFFLWQILGGGGGSAFYRQINNVFYVRTVIQGTR